MIEKLQYREPKPPEGWPVGKTKLFYDQSFKLQCFIYLKYREHWPKRLLMKFLFLASECTYYKYDHLAKELINIAFSGK